ncbi:MAG: lipoyl(octanoyl) transferase LipB [Thermodesulfobacteriota bacterium]
MNGFKAYRLGRLDYGTALSLQKRFVELRHRGEIEDTIILVEHPHTFTMGRGGDLQNLHLSAEELLELGIHFEVISRGGDITYHGPGQVVGYPIVDLRGLNSDVHRFIRLIEEVLIVALKDFGIQSHGRNGLTGVWAGEEKVASVGIGVKKWVTYHGFALNVNTDLSYFNLMNPCGLHNVKMTSVKRLLGKDEDLNISQVESAVISAFGSAFGLKESSDINDSGEIYQLTGYSGFGNPNGAKTL